MTEGGLLLLYSAPEGRKVCKQLLVQHPLCDTVVAVAVDEAHCVQVARIELDIS